MAEIKLKIASVVIGSGEGGGSGVAPYYADLPDKPSINGETLSGDMTSEDLGLASESQAVPSGGTTGQVLAKKSNADNDVQWVNQESGGQGTTNYADLENKPKINNVTLSGNKTAAQLGLQAELESGTNIKTINNQSIVGSGNITIEAGGTDDYSDLGNKPQINSVTLSGNKSASALGLATATQGAKADSAYQKPSSNIPSADLASDVQTSLGKANSSVQNITRGGSTLQKTNGVVDIPEEIESAKATSVPSNQVATANIDDNHVLQLEIPRGADAVNPFKGWFDDTTALNTAYPTPSVGDYAYIENNGTTYVYRCATEGTWPTTSTEEKEPSSATFATAQLLNNVRIDGTNLVNPVGSDESNNPTLAKAEDVMQLKAKLNGVTAEEKSINKSTLTDYLLDTQYNVKTGYYNISGDYCPSSINKSVKISVEGYKSMRFFGIIRKTAPDAGQPCYCFLNANDEIISGSLVEYDKDENLDNNTTKEYVVTIPNNAEYALLLWAGAGGLTVDNFYCYLQRGETVIEIVGYNFAYNQDITEYVLNLQEKNLIIGTRSTNWSDNGTHVVFDVAGIGAITIEPKNLLNGNIAFLKSYYNPVAGATPDYAEGTTIFTFNQQTKFIVPIDTKYIYFIASSSNVSMKDRYNSIVVDGKVNVQNVGKRQPAKGILYVELDVNTKAISNGINIGGTSDSNTTSKSSFGVKFPSNYTPNGTPTRVLAMFHGYNGYVSGNATTNIGSVLGYDNNDWINFQTTFVNAGFAVMDINGYGVYGENNYNHHWGCPGAVMTVKKAFEYLKTNFNVYDELLIFGFSMGGALAWSYTMNFPQDVVAVAMHEPATPTNNDEQNSPGIINPTIAQAYGYNSWNDVVNDNFGSFVGYSLPLSLQRYDNGVANFGGIVGFDISHALPNGTELIGSFPRPVRIWQGTMVESGSGGETVSVELNENIVNALRKSGSNASIRYCPGLTHSDLKTTQYVVDETLYFLLRYK